MYGSYNYWRETQRQARFLFLDARIVIFIGIALIHLRIWTLLMLVAAGVAFWWVDRKGLGLAGAARYFRVLVSGSAITARGRENLRLPIDYGYETGAYSAPSGLPRIQPAPQEEPWHQG